MKKVEKIFKSLLKVDYLLDYGKWKEVKIQDELIPTNTLNGYNDWINAVKSKLEKFIEAETFTGLEALELHEALRTFKISIQDPFYKEYFQSKGDLKQILTWIISKIY